MGIYNCDCIEGAKQHFKDGSVDLMICDPPFGINETTFGKHYYRDESKVLKGYVEAPKDYNAFSFRWLNEARRVTKENGSIWIISGYTNLFDILDAIRDLGLVTINHCIWKFNFGCNTTKKFVSSHYHLLYLKKFKSSRPTFNTYCRFGYNELDEKGNTLLYRDLEDVWVINKDYKPGEIKNKNKLPDELIRKIVLYCSNENDVVCDFFLGNFTTAFVAKGLNRVPVGFEINKESYDYFMPLLEKKEAGCDLATLKQVPNDRPARQGSKITDEEAIAICGDYKELIKDRTKEKVITDLCNKYQRGYWSMMRLIKRCQNLD